MPLEHFGPQVVAVVLGDGGHHVERQGPGGTGAELVVDEGQLHATGVFEFLQAGPHPAYSGRRGRACGSGSP